MHVGERIPVQFVPLLQPYDLSQFREIAKGALPFSLEKIACPGNKNVGRMFGVEIYDASMAQEQIEKGDVALVDPDSKCEVGSAVAVIVPERGRILIRRYHGREINADREYIILAAFAYRFPTIETYLYGEDASQTIGRVCGISRSYV